jgi:hypothetical protein
LFTQLKNPCFFGGASGGIFFLRELCSSSDCFAISLDVAEVLLSFVLVQEILSLTVIIIP